MLDKLLSTMKRVFRSSLFWVLIICGCVQFFVYRTYTEPHVNADSYSYFRSDYDKSYRTPVYPYLIKAVRVISGNERCYYNVVIIQEVIYFVSIIFFYLAIKKITKKRAIIVAASLLYGCMPSLFCWSQSVLTESLTISVTTVIAYLTISYFVKPNAIYAILIAALSYFVIMLKPAMIFLLPIFLVFWVIKLFANKEKKERIRHGLGLASCLLAIALLVGYCFSIKERFGFFGVSWVSNHNKMWLLTESGLYAKSQDREKVELMESGELWHGYFLLVNRYGMDETMKYWSETVKQNLPEYLSFLAKKAISYSKETIHTVYSTGYLGKINDVPDEKAVLLTGVSGIMLPISCGMMYVILIFDIVYLIYLLIKRKTMDWMVAFTTAFVFCNFFLSMFMAPFEFQRLFSVSVPFLIIMLAHYANKIVCRGKDLAFEERIFPAKTLNKKQLLLIGSLSYNSICNLKKHKNK